MNQRQAKKALWKLQQLNKRADFNEVEHNINSLLVNIEKLDEIITNFPDRTSAINRLYVYIYNAFKRQAPKITRENMPDFRAALGNFEEVVGRLNENSSGFMYGVPMF